MSVVGCFVFGMALVKPLLNRCNTGQLLGFGVRTPSLHGRSILATFLLSPAPSRVISIVSTFQCKGNKSRKALNCLYFHQKIKSQVTMKKLVPTAPQNIICAMFFFFVASLRFLFPFSTFSRENSLSATNCVTCSDCISRFAASSVWREEISRREDSAVLGSC